MTMRKATSKKYNLKKRGKTHKNKNLKKRTKKRVLKRKARSRRRKTKKGGRTRQLVAPKEEGDIRDAPLPPLPTTPIVVGSKGEDLLYASVTPQRKSAPPLPPKHRVNIPKEFTRRLATRGNNKNENKN